MLSALDFVYRFLLCAIREKADLQCAFNFPNNSWDSDEFKLELDCYVSCFKLPNYLVLNEIKYYYVRRKQKFGAKCLPAILT